MSGDELMMNVFTWHFKKSKSADNFYNKKTFFKSLHIKNYLLRHSQRANDGSLYFLTIASFEINFMSSWNKQALDLMRNLCVGDGNFKVSK